LAFKIYCLISSSFFCFWIKTKFCFYF